MANANKPMGMSPHSYLNGAQWNEQGTVYFIPSTDNNAYAIGDPVTLAGSGDANGVASVTLATAGDAHTLLGPIVGYGGTVYGGAFTDPNAPFSSTIIPATKTQGYYVLVCDDPQVLFEMQEDSASANLAVTDIGSNANLVSGTNNGYVSGWLLDSTPVATTSTFQVQIMRLVQRADNSIGQYAKWLVRMNNHHFKVGTTGV